MPNPSKSKKRPGVVEQREIILAAAIDLFGVEGKKAVSVSRICAKAGVSRDTYYRCFADKESLISHLYQTAVNSHIEDVFSNWQLDYSNHEWLQRACGQTIDAILEQHKVTQFLFVESADPNSLAYKVIHRAYNKAAKEIQRWCKQQYGESPSIEYLVALLVAVQWLVHNAIIKGMGKGEVNKAKLAAEQLFFAALGNRK